MRISDWSSDVCSSDLEWLPSKHQTVVCSLNGGRDEPGDRLLQGLDARPGPLGAWIEAQRAAVTRFAEAEGIALVAEHVEMESGKGPDALVRRPHLRTTLDAARTARCPVTGSPFAANRPASQPRPSRPRADAVGGFGGCPTFVPRPLRA